MKDTKHGADPDRMDAARLSVRPRSRHPVPAEVSLYRDGALAPSDATAIRAHLRSCPRCRRVGARLSEATRVLGHQADGLTAGILGQQADDLRARIPVQMHRALVDETTQRKSQWPPAPRSPSLHS